MKPTGVSKHVFNQMLVVRDVIHQSRGRGGGKHLSSCCFQLEVVMRLKVDNSASFRTIQRLIVEFAAELVCQFRRCMVPTSTLQHFTYGTSFAYSVGLLSVASLQEAFPNGIDAYFDNVGGKSARGTVKRRLSSVLVV